MPTSRSTQGIHVPPGCRDWFVPLLEPTARALRRADIRIVGISDVRYGFQWAGPALNHLLVGTIEGSGYLETDCESRTLGEGTLVLSPAETPRRFGTRGRRWKFLAIRLADSARWRHLVDRGVRPIGGDWLKRLVPPVEGMLSESPLETGVMSHAQMPQLGGETSPRDLRARYADYLADQDAAENAAPRADAFELYANILRGHVESILAPRPTALLDDESVALASLWSRVANRPGEPWDADQLCSALAVSRSSLHRMVKRQHGMSPARVVERLRMQEAMRLLSESEYTIDAVAMQVGYATAFSFSAAFKRVVGEPPSVYRARTSAVIPEVRSDDL